MMTMNGCTMCNTPGHEMYEKYTYGRKKQTAYQYDYRHTDGTLFSCCAATLEQCRAKRDQWLKSK